MHRHTAGSPFMFVLLILVAAMALLYPVLAIRQHKQGRPWPWTRTAVFLAGCGLLGWGLLPQYLPFAEADFRKHMLQHLFMGMFAPLGLVIAAPVTLLLRTMPALAGRRLSRLLRKSLLRVIANPVTALVINTGGMALLYFTPLYEGIMMRPALHCLLHVHFVAAGCLYTWAIAGPDPGPHRPSVPMRLVVLGAAVVFHSILAQMIYAGALVAVSAPAVQLQHGAELMYYGGDVAEMLLAFALVTTWRPNNSYHPGPRRAQVL